MFDRAVISCRAFDLKLHSVSGLFHRFYNLHVSILLLLQFVQYFAGVTVHPEEIVGLLVNSGMFDRAVIICRAFDLKLHSVFENLALRYICIFFIILDFEYRDQTCINICQHLRKLFKPKAPRQMVQTASESICQC